MGCATGTIAKAQDDEVSQLRDQQQALAERYRQLEAKLFSLHQFEKNNNPARSKLLRQAFLQSQEKSTVARLDKVAKLLQSEDFKQAEQLQSLSINNLNEMLKLLQAENRTQLIRDDLERYKAYAKEVDRILRIQRGIRGQAEGGVSPERLAKSESKATDRTKKLADQIRQENKGRDGTDPDQADDSNDSDGSPSGEPEQDSETGPSSEADSEAQGATAKPGQTQDADQPAPSDSSEPTDGDSDSADPSKPSEAGGAKESGPPSSDQPPGSAGQGQAGDQDSQTEPESDDPIQRKVDAARRRMQQAQQDLKNAEQENAIQAMREAERELEEAKKELQEILRQLREEEVESQLKLLEERFRGMLEKQIRVNESTTKLSAVPTSARGTEFEISASRLAGEENQIAAAAGRALSLLKQDATAIAFPVTVQELQEDMLTVSQRLTAAKVNATTLAIQADIVETLNELIDALVRTQEDLEKAKQQQQPPSRQSSSQPGEAPLVDKIAELKMLKSMQVRIHRRHERYAKFLADPHDPNGVNQDADVAAALQRLADRQAKLTLITRQLVNEENN